MAATSWAVVFAVVCLACIAPAYPQTVIDNDVCEQYGTHCPEEGDPSYKTYCCVEHDGGVAIYSCCNPYFGLYIGIGVGVPVIIAIVVLVVLTYCLCVRNHNRKMRALVAAYNARRQRELEERNLESSLAAPPPYARLEGEEEEEERKPPGHDPELPQYAEEDPYGPRGVLMEREGGGDGTEEGGVADRETDSLSDEGNAQLSDATPLITEQS